MRLPVRHRREVKLLDCRKSRFVFSRDRLVLARAEGKEFLVDYTLLQELEERLPEGQFVRVHRGALVNMSAIGKLWRGRRRAGAATERRHAGGSERAAGGGVRRKLR